MKQIAASPFINVNGSSAAPLLHPGYDNCALTTSRKWIPCAGIVASLTAANGLPARRAQLHISVGCLSDPSGPWGARLWEKKAPEGARRVEWILTCDAPLCSAEDALRLLNETSGLVTAFACC